MGVDQWFTPATCLEASCLGVAPAAHETASHISREGSLVGSRPGTLPPLEVSAPRFCIECPQAEGCSTSTDGVMPLPSMIFFLYLWKPACPRIDWVPTAT